MFNFLKKKGKEKSNFFDNKVISTPKSSKIFRKFVQSDVGMGQNNSSGKSNAKKPLNRSESKDEEYNTAPNSPDIQQRDFMVDNFLAIDDDDSEIGSSDSLLQNNNQVQHKPESPSPSTSNHDSKPTSPGKPSVLLKSTPDAFYNKKTNNNLKRKDILKAQLTNGLQNESSSSNNTSSEEKQIKIVQQNCNNNYDRRNSDTNELLSKQNTQQTASNVSLRKQNSVDSIQKNSTDYKSIELNGLFKNNTKLSKPLLSDSIQLEFQNNAVNHCKETYKNNIINNGNVSVLQEDLLKTKDTEKENCEASSSDDVTKQTADFAKIHERNDQNLDGKRIAQVSSLEKSKKRIPETPVDSESSPRGSDENLNETASIVVKSKKNTTVSNAILDVDDSDTSLDSCSITASFELKEATEDYQKENLSIEENNETVTYLTCSEKQEVGTDNQSSTEKKLEDYKELNKEIINFNEEYQIKDKTEPTNSKTDYNDLNSNDSISENNSLNSIQITNERVHASHSNEFYHESSGEVPPKKLTTENSIEGPSEASMCPSEYIDDHTIKENIIKENTIEIFGSEQLDTFQNSDYQKGSDKEVTESEKENTYSGNEKVGFTETKSTIEQKELENFVENRLPEEDENSRNRSGIVGKESESEEESQEDENKEEEEEEEEIVEEEKTQKSILKKDLSSSNVMQMETDGVIGEPQRKFKKFVRFGLIHNTYHGSDTESEEEEEGEEEEEEEEEEENEEEEESEEELQDEEEEVVATSKIEDKPVDIVQIPEPDVTEQPEQTNQEPTLSTPETDENVKATELPKNP